MGCRNTVFNAKAQSAAMDLAALKAAKVGFFRLELVDEAPEVVETLVRPLPRRPGRAAESRPAVAICGGAEGLERPLPGGRARLLG